MRAFENHLRARFMPFDAKMSVTCVEPMQDQLYQLNGLRTISFVFSNL